jgi:DNA-binding NarL/FixJ family response regulator
MKGIPVTRVAIVGQSDLVRNGLERILSRRPGVEVAAGVDRPARLPVGDFGRESAHSGLDVIVLAVSRWYEGDPAEAIDTLSAHGRVLVVSELFELHPLTAALRAGAYGCVPEHVDEDELLCAVRTVARGGIHVSPALSPLLQSELREPDRQPPVALAPRECETLGWLAVGLTHRQIAGRMGLTEATVSTYVKRIRGKLNVGNKADLTRVAIELGLLDDAGQRIPQQRAVALDDA